MAVGMGTGRRHCCKWEWERICVLLVYILCRYNSLMNGEILVVQGMYWAYDHFDYHLLLDIAVVSLDCFIKRLLFLNVLVVYSIKVFNGVPWAGMSTFLYPFIFNTPRHIPSHSIHPYKRHANQTKSH